MGLVLALSVPLNAWATCLLECDGDLMNAKSCEVLPDGDFVGGPMATFTLACQTCCSPPGGPLECAPTEPTPDLISVIGKWGAKARPIGRRMCLDDSAGRRAR
jgi:hypothetical protein